MTLTQTQTLWGSGYLKRWFINGRRISQSNAEYMLDSHAWERDGTNHSGGTYRYLYNIGPHHDTPSLMDHPDML